MILGQLRMGARQAKNAPLFIFTTYVSCQYCRINLLHCYITSRYSIQKLGSCCLHLVPLDGDTLALASSSIISFLGSFMVSCLQVSLEEALLFFSGPAKFPASSSTFQKLSTPPGAYEGLGRTACNNLNIVTKKKCPCPRIFCSWQVTRRCLCQRAPRGIGR